jgi:hypothetical protein
MIDIPQGLWAETIEIFRSCGNGRRECVAYWRGPAADPARITRVVHPKHTATAGHYRVDDAWLTRFWIELAKAGESVRVQVHTHGGRAGHSGTDNEGALVYQAGFLSLVLPGFASRDDCRWAAFLAELDEAGRWRSVSLDGRLRWA